MIVDEPLLSGPDAIERVTGHRPHYSQFFRWTRYGLRSRGGKAVRLEFVKAGSKRLTSESAVRRFLMANTAAASEAVDSASPAILSTATQGEIASQLDSHRL